MPVYKVESNYLIEAIESVLNQTFKDFLFLVILDGDRSHLEIINAYSLKDKRIIILENEDNRGISHSINRSFEETSATYIIRMDADDVCLPNRFEHLLEISKYGYKLISSGCYMIDEESNIIGKSRKYPFHSFIRSSQLYLFGLNPVIHPAVMIHRSVLEEYKYNEELKYAQDLDLWLRAADKYKFHFISEPLIMYRKYRYNDDKIKIKNTLHNQIVKSYRMRFIRNIIK